MVSHLRRLLPLNRLRELDISALDKSVGGGVVAVMWQEVVVKLPEHVQGDPGIIAVSFQLKVRKEASRLDSRKPIRSLPAVWSQHIVVCLAEHVVELVESKMLGEQLVGEAVHSGQAVQFYYSCYVASLEPGNMSMATLTRIVQKEVIV